MALDLLLLSYANLDTPKGKQLVSSVVNESDILKKLDEYKSRYPNIDISSITSAVQQELSDVYSNRSNTSAEQRAQNRKDRQKERDERKRARQQNRELKQQTAEQRLRERLENAGVVDIDKERTRIGAEIAILISKLKSNRPEITKFTISGTLIDSITSEPIQGAEIFLGVNPNPFPNVTDLDVVSIENSKNALLDEEELSILGNISSKDYNNLKESNPQQQYNLARAISNYRTIKYEKALEAEGSPLQSLKGITVTPDQLGALIEESETVEEMEGLDLRVDPNSFLYIPVKAFKNPKYGTVNDEFLGEDLEEITGNRSDQTKNVITNKTGNFQIDIYIPIIPSTQKCTLDVAILSKKSPENNVNGEPIRGTGYTPGTFIILNGDRTIKTELGIKKVTKFSSVSKKIVTEYNNRIDEAQDKINQIALGAAELVLSQRKTALNKITNAIKSRLIPLVIGLMLQFGITKISEANRKTCPTQGELDDVIRQRNKINRQMNNIFKSIVSNTAIAAAFLVLANVLRGVRLSLDALPFPQAFGTPPGPAGGLIFAQPYSTSAKLQRINEKLEELSAANKELNKAILTNLIFVIAGLATVVILLKAIDDLIQECAEENGVTEVELEEINQELLDLAEEGEDDGNPIISNINGFELSVETDDSNPVGSLKRRFAVAKDTRGITLLRGEPSFSSSDQILIDELIFYIQQNNLKAF